MQYLVRSCTRNGLVLFVLASISAIGHAVTGVSPAAQQQPRIVAVGDIHGDFERLTRILQRVGIIDGERRWVAGNSILVQTGDFLDRGAYVRQIMDLLMALEKEAPRYGGRVEILLGNHEVMNLVGNLRDVNPNVYAAFSVKDSEERRKKAYEDYLKLRREQSRRRGQPEPQITEEFQQQWMSTHPPGSLEYRQAMGPKGKYGSWLRKHSVLSKISDIIFMHAGLHQTFVSSTLKTINKRVESELEAFDNYKEYLRRRQLILPFSSFLEVVAAARTEVRVRQPHSERASEFNVGERQHVEYLQEFLKLGNWFILHSEGPLWFRGFATWSRQEGKRHISELLKAHDAEHFVVAHTPYSDAKIRERFSGRVFLIDTAMSRVYAGGRASALEIHNGGFTAIYLSGTEFLFDAGDE